MLSSTLPPRAAVAYNPARNFAVTQNIERNTDDMIRLKLRLLIAVLTFVTGVAVDSSVRRIQASTMPDCWCTSAKCRIVAIADNPLDALTHPADTLQSLSQAHWTD
ncbi:MAG: hypothetical protein M3458_06285 [Acidobacteriota bacterium]|nr:hypothetical protein [Acidobacteriota bacterium]